MLFAFQKVANVSTAIEAVFRAAVDLLSAFRAKYMLHVFPSCSDFYDGGFIEQLFAVVGDGFAILRENLLAVGFDGGDVEGVTVDLQRGEVSLLERETSFCAQKFAGCCDGVFSGLIKAHRQFFS